MEMALNHEVLVKMTWLAANNEQQLLHTGGRRHAVCRKHIGTDPQVTPLLKLCPTSCFTGIE